MDSLSTNQPAEIASVVAVATHTEPAEGNPLLRLDPGLVIWTWVIFFTLLFLLGKFAWRPILKALGEREKTIKEALDNTEKTRKLLEEANASRAAVLEEAEKKALEIVNQSREAAQDVAMEINKKALHESERVIDQAKKAIQAEKERAVAELRKETALLAVSIASKLIGTNLDDSKNRELTDRFIQEAVKS